MAVTVHLEHGEPVKIVGSDEREVSIIAIITGTPRFPYQVRFNCFETSEHDTQPVDMPTGRATTQFSLDPGKYTFDADVLNTAGDVVATASKVKITVRGEEKPVNQPAGGHIDVIGNRNLWVPYAYVHDANDKPAPGVLVTFRSRRDPVQFPVFTNVHGMAEKPYPMNAGDKPEKVTVTVSRVPKMHADFGLEPPMALWSRTNNKIAKWMLILTVVWTLFSIGFVGFSDPPKPGVVTIAPEEQQARDFLHRGFEINSATGKVQPKAAPQPKVEEPSGWQSLMDSTRPWSWWLVLGLWVFSPVYTLFALREESASLWRGTMNIWENQRLEIIPSAEGPQVQRAPAGFLSQTAAAVAAQAAPKFGVKLWEFAKNVASVMVGNVITH